MGGLEGNECHTVIRGVDTDLRTFFILCDTLTSLCQIPEFQCLQKECSTVLPAVECFKFQF